MAWASWDRGGEKGSTFLSRMDWRTGYVYRHNCHRYELDEATRENRWPESINCINEVYT